MRSAHLIMLSVGILFVNSTASALPFDPLAVSGTATLTAQNDGFAPDLVQTSPVAFPESFSQILTSSITGAQAELEYDLFGLGNKAVFDVYVRGLSGDGALDFNGFAEFDVTFTTTIDTIFSLTAVSPDRLGTIAFFETTLNGIVANKFVDISEPNGIGGNFPESPIPGNPRLDTFTADGVLAAGTYTLTVEANGFPHRGQGGATTDGTVNLTLQPVPEMTTAVLATMGLAGLALGSGRRRHE